VIENDVDLNWLLLDKGNLNSIKTDSRFQDIENRLKDIESNLYNDRGLNKRATQHNIRERLFHFEKLKILNLDDFRNKN
jgi:hypothetical protein